MKIINKQTAPVPISDISIGGTFLYAGSLHIKTNGRYRSSIQEGYPNSVLCLEDGRENGFANSIDVLPVEVTAEYK